MNSHIYILVHAIMKSKGNKNLAVGVTYVIFFSVSAVIIVSPHNHATPEITAVKSMCRENGTRRLLDVQHRWCFIKYMWSLCERKRISEVNTSLIILTIVYTTDYSDADQRKHQSSASLALVRGIHWGPANSPHKWPVTRKCLHLMTSSWV